MLWFRCYNEMRNDTKLRLIASALDTEEAFVHGMWIDVLCLAAELDQDWRLRVDESLELSFTQVAREVRVSRELAERFLAAAVEFGLVGQDDRGLFIASGLRRHMKPSDRPERVAERMKRYRETPHGKLRVSFDNNRDRLYGEVARRDGEHCAECGSTDDLEVYHVIPLSSGGNNDLSNLQILCKKHNRRKGTRRQRHADVTRNETPQEVEVEEEQELNPQSATHSPPPSPKRPVVSAPTEADWQTRADELLAASHFPSDLLQLAGLLGSENKTGKVSLSRVVRELYEPIVALQDELPDAAIRYGLRSALTARNGRGAPNANYVAKAARGYQGNGSAPATNSYADELTDEDRDFFTVTER